MNGKNTEHALPVNLVRQNGSKGQSHLPGKTMCSPCWRMPVGIQPNGTSYNTSKILKAIQDATSKTADIVCNKDKDGNMYLFEVRLCFN
ncbi:ribonuclease 1-like [Quillaja saponaria]|uniref:Ribonuclease 1-like n=1 Tax=Quillaja saponaria TaxID=32244 RepID=A0AAD7M6L0_QUISA|nr:ribonuclease 1-like [Quillaja saponaria]